MTRSLWESPLGRLGIFLCLALFISLSIPLPAQNNQVDYQTQLEIDDIKERVRSLYAQEQYEQVLQELDRLEQIAPNEPAVQFYRGLAERRLRQGPRIDQTPRTTPAPVAPGTGNLDNIPPPPPPSGDPSLNPIVTAAPPSPASTGEVDLAPAPSSGGSGRTGLIAGVLLGIALIIVLAVAIVMVIKRGKKSHVPPVGAVEQFQSPMPPSPYQPQAPPSPYQPYSSAPSPNPYEPPAAGGIGMAVGDSFFSDGSFQDSHPGNATPQHESPAHGPMDMHSGDFEEIPKSAGPPPLSPVSAGQDSGAPPFFGGDAPMGGSIGTGNVPSMNSPLFNAPPEQPASGFEAPGGLGGFGGLDDFAGQSSPLEFPFESAESSPAASPPPQRSTPAQPSLPSGGDLSSISFDLGVSFEMDESAKPEPPKGTPPTSPVSSEIGFDDLDLGDMGFHLDTPDSAKQPVPVPPPPSHSKPLIPEAPSAEGINLDDFIFSGDLHTNVPGVSAPQTPPRMAGESQFPVPSSNEPTTAAEDMMFSGIDQTTFPTGGDITLASTFGSVAPSAPGNSKKPSPAPAAHDISEDQTFGGFENLAAPPSSPGPREEKALEPTGMNFITNGDTKTSVPEETRILSPREFGVTRSKELDRKEKESSPIAKAEPAGIQDQPKTAGPMDQTAFLGNIDKKSISSGSDNVSDSKAKTSETLFDKHYAQGLEAFDAGEWKEAIYHLNVAYTLKPNSQDVRDKLREARRHRKEARLGG